MDLKTKQEKVMWPLIKNVFINLFYVVLFIIPTDLGGDGELCYDNCNWVRVLWQLPGAGQLHHLLVVVRWVGQQGFGVSQALDQGLNLIEVSLLPEQLSLLEVARQRQLWRPQEVEDVADTAETETGSVQTAELMIQWKSELSL